MEGTDATPEEVAEFREIFNLVDLDGGGPKVSEDLAKRAAKVFSGMGDKRMNEEVISDDTVKSVYLGASFNL